MRRKRALIQKTQAERPTERLAQALLCTSGRLCTVSTRPCSWIQNRQRGNQRDIPKRQRSGPWGGEAVSSMHPSCCRQSTIDLCTTLRTTAIPPSWCIAVDSSCREEWWRLMADDAVAIQKRQQATQTRQRATQGTRTLSQIAVTHISCSRGCVRVAFGASFFGAPLV